MPKSISKEKKLDWTTKIRQQKESGLSINEWCRKNQITKGSFHYWKNHFQPDISLTRSSFKELPVDQGTGISIEYQGVRILINKCFDPTTLKNCISALRGLSC